MSDTLSPPDSTPGRVWQACQSCRRKKVKCDGKTPCHNCSSRGHSCVFPEAKDHASVSRYYASSLEARCQHMDMVCQRLERLAETISRAASVLSNTSNRAPSNGKLSEDLIEAAHVLGSLPGGLPASQPQQGQPTELDALPTGQFAPQDSVAAQAFEDAEFDYSDPDDDVGGDAEDGDVAGGQIAGRHPDNGEQRRAGEAPEQEGEGNKADEYNQDQAGALVRDSYGRLRFVGGAANKMLIDAAKTASPLSQTTMTPPMSVTNQQVGEDVSHNADFELPLFVRGRVWPELPFLPKPEQLSRPPQYVSDILISLYFDRLHYTFPVIFKPHFMEKYARMLRGDSTSSASGQDCPQDKEFLMVFFAVCACASGLLPPGAERGFPGLEYYEKALLLHYASPGQASLENVQCLGLLSMCAASWNTLTRSWSLAGQAVRSAMDIGLHLSNRSIRPAGAQAGSISVPDRLQQQISRRTWWSIFCLDRVVSICLGRPMAVQERDCSCELPLDLSDHDLERHCSAAGASSASSIPAAGSPPPLTGFLAFARLCQLSGRIQQLGSPLQLRRSSCHDAERADKYLSRVSALDHALQKWLEALPDTVRFSASDADAATAGDSGLIMRVAIFIVHAGSLLNLYRDLVYFLSRSGHAGSSGYDQRTAEATAQCIKAAKRCISAAEPVRSLVPPSHYLAICVHCVTLSGVALLCMSPKPLEPHTIDAAVKCVGYLQSLESRWSGASRSRAIIEHLIAKFRHQQQQQQQQQHHITNPCVRAGILTPAEQIPAVAVTNKRGFDAMVDDGGFQLDDILWGDGLPWLDTSDQGGTVTSFGHWNSL